MPDRLKLTYNAQFYQPKYELTAEMVESILAGAESNMIEDSEPIIRVAQESGTLAGTDDSYRFSATMFVSQRAVYFFEDPEAESQPLDLIHAYFLLVETKGYVAVLKKSCANVNDLLDEHLEKVDHSVLFSTFDDEAVDFQKMAVRNMTISERALRTRSYEAADLKGLLSTHAAGRSIPFFLRIRQNGNLKSISTNSGRMVEVAERKQIADVVVWINQQIDLITAPSEKSFLNSFAKSVSLEEVLSVAKPSAILIESTFLADLLLTDNLPLKYKTRKGKVVELSQNRKNRLFAALEKVYELDDDLNFIGQRGKLRKNAKTLSIASPALSRVKVEEKGKLVTLQKYIAKHGLFSVCFDNPKYMYFMGTCFEDQSGISQIDSILDILEPRPELASSTSEKGTLSATHAAFDQNSVFGAVEAVHANDDYVFCDDLGTEWADHISLNQTESCICFIHSKHAASTTSAAQFHDVVGQGIKNLGYMYFSQEEFVEKYNSKLSETYAGTQIHRIRKGDAGNLELYLKALLPAYKLHRKCILACSFLSKAEIKSEFQKIKDGESVRGHITQLLWILSSFAHAAKDMNVIPIIYCLP